MYILTKDAFLDYNFVSFSCIVMMILLASFEILCARLSYRSDAIIISPPFLRFRYIKSLDSRISECMYRRSFFDSLMIDILQTVVGDLCDCQCECIPAMSDEYD